MPLLLMGKHADFLDIRTQKRGSALIPLSICCRYGCRYTISLSYDRTLPTTVPSHDGEHCCYCLRTWCAVQGWEIRVDPASGERYFANHRRRITTWNGECIGGSIFRSSSSQTMVVWAGTGVILFLQGHSSSPQVYLT